MDVQGLSTFLTRIVPTFLYRPLLWSILFSFYAAKQFFRQQGLQTASYLAYATLLSLVPLLTVMFGFVGGLPFFEKISLDIQTFIFENFVPSFGHSVQNYLLEFSSKASNLTFTGTVILLFIALMLIATIDDAFNKIWNVKNERNLISRFLVYWSILTLGPLLIGFGLFSTSYLLTLPAFNELYPSLGLQAKLLRILPFLTTSIAFSTVYVLVPNCLVPKRNAIIGGVIAAILFEIAKFTFGIYVKAVPSYETIYGAIAIIPLFLLWIYLSWAIIILGAHLSYCLSNFDLHDDYKYRDGRWDFIAVYMILGLLRLAQKQGQGLTVADFKKQGLALSQSQIAEILYVLSKANWVKALGNGQYVLSRDMSDCKVKDLHELLPCKFILHRSSWTKAQGNIWFESLHEMLGQYKKVTDEVLDLSLESLFSKAVAKPGLS